MKLNNMKTQKWKWKIDQWFEEKVWTLIPKKYATPHFFFILGFMFAFLLLIIFGFFISLI
jgi:hypothetical protein